MEKTYKVSLKPKEGTTLKRQTIIVQAPDKPTACDLVQNQYGSDYIINVEGIIRKALRENTNPFVAEQILEPINEEIILTNEEIDQINEEIVPITKLNESDDSYDILKTNITEKLNLLKGETIFTEFIFMDINKSIDDFKNYLIDGIPDILERAKIGRGGERFANEVYEKLFDIFWQELNSKSITKRLSLEKDLFIESSLKPNQYDKFFDCFFELIDFTSQVGHLPQYEKVTNEMKEFSTQTSNYIKRFKDKVINDLVNKIVKFLFD
jgi:hypothetical protein